MAKRITDLDPVSSTVFTDHYVEIDKVGLTESKKVLLSKILELYSYTYTSFAELGLTDASFSATDWDANARLIFNAMDANTTFKAGLCGSSEMPNLNASIVASSASSVLGPALEFNKENGTSSPCIVIAKENNSSRRSYYNIDNAGSEWVEVATRAHVAANYLSIPTKITSGYLNDYKTAGMFYCDSNAAAANIIGLPTEVENLAFTLLVEASASAKQTLTTQGYNCRTFIRQYNSYYVVWGDWVELALKATVEAEYLPVNKVYIFSWTSGTLQLPNTANTFIGADSGIAGDWSTVALPIKGGMIKEGSQVSVSWPRKDNDQESIHIVAPAGYSFFGGCTVFDIGDNQGMTFVLQGTVYYAVVRSQEYSW